MRWEGRVGFGREPNCRDRRPSEHLSEPDLGAPENLGMGDESMGERGD